MQVENNNCKVLVDYIKRSSDFDIVVSRKELSDLLTTIENQNNESSLKGLLEKKEILEEEVSFLEGMN